MLNTELGRPQSRVTSKLLKTRDNTICNIISTNLWFLVLGIIEERIIIPSFRLFSIRVGDFFGLEEVPVFFQLTALLFLVINPYFIGVV